MLDKARALATALSLLMIQYKIPFDHKTSSGMESKEASKALSRSA